MDSDTPSSLYSGLPKFSYIPEGLVSHVAPSPSQLCVTCSSLDYPSYFIRGHDLGHKYIFDEEHLLGTYEAIFSRALSCGFCRLAVEAFSNGVHRLNNLEPPFIKDGRSIKVFLDSVRAGHYRTRVSADLDESARESGEEVMVGCIIVYTDLDPFTTTHLTPSGAAYIRLLAKLT